MSKVEAKYADKFRDLSNKTYAAQAKWFLNGFWDEVGKDAEQIWKYVHKCIELDDRRSKGNDLDEFNAHRFLEFLGDTQTVQEMRNKMRDIDIDFNKRMCLTEYLIFKYKKSVKDVVNAPQGENKEEIIQAQSMVDAAQTAVDSLTKKLEEQTKAVKKQAAAEYENRQAEAAAKKG